MCIIITIIVVVITKMKLINHLTKYNNSNKSKDCSPNTSGKEYYN